jgi:hypothetical protein
VGGCVTIGLVPFRLSLRGSHGSATVDAGLGWASADKSRSRRLRWRPRSGPSGLTRRRRSRCQRLPAVHERSPRRSTAVISMRQKRIPHLRVEPGSPVRRYPGKVVVTLGVDPEAVVGDPVPFRAPLVDGLQRGQDRAVRDPTCLAAAYRDGNSVPIKESINETAHSWISTDPAEWLDNLHGVGLPAGIPALRRGSMWRRDVVPSGPCRKFRHLLTALTASQVQRRQTNSYYAALL